MNKNSSKKANKLYIKNEFMSSSFHQVYIPSSFKYLNRNFVFFSLYLNYIIKEYVHKLVKLKLQINK